MAIRVGERIKELRARRGWSQGELARRLGVTRPTVSQWESGDTKNLREQNIISVAKAFGMTVDELMIGTKKNTIAEECPPYGARAATMPEEILLKKYRSLSKQDQERLQKIIDALATELTDKRAK